jgi:uncharacterized membrane protein YedE/YeeE
VRTTSGLLLIGAGGILAFAVSANTSVFNWNVAGFVLIFVGLLGLFLPRRSYGWLGRRIVRRTRWWPSGQRVDQAAYPPYVVRNPGNQRVKAGLPVGGFGPGDPPVEEDGAPVPAPRGSEVVEDVYEEE